jgi:hypothetical protein
VRLGREVDDRFAACARERHVGGLRDVAVVELDLGGQVRAVPGVRQLVEHDDLVPGAEQPFHEVRADEAGAAGDENLHARRVMGVAQPV